MTTCLPAITAVIPAYRSAERIGIAVRSVLLQPDVKARVVVVVDDQSPATAAAASDFGSSVSVIVNERNLGSAVSRNVGLEQVNTPFVIFLDSDDWVEGRLLAGLCAAIERDKADLGFGTFVNLREASGLREPQPPPAALNNAALFEQWLIGLTYVAPCAVVWRTDTVRAIGGWDAHVRRGDDAELACRALLLGRRFTTSEDGNGVYLFHESPYRVSRQSSRCADLKILIDKLVTLPGAVLPRQVIDQAAAQAYYEVARVAFVEGNPTLGRAALAASRALGFAGHRGSIGARVLGSLIGLENRLRLRSAIKPG
jgi:glycosyltransferase involved in cell wall biosynthesis